MLSSERQATACGCLSVLRGERLVVGDLTGLKRVCIEVAVRFSVAKRSGILDVSAVVPSGLCFLGDRRSGCSSAGLAFLNPMIASSDGKSSSEGQCGPAIARGIL